MAQPWRNYHADFPQNTVVGELLWLADFHSPQLDNSRTLQVWLPPSYQTASDKRYPVIYMHDGQNLFDIAPSFAGEWQADETMTQLAEEGFEAIMVGLANHPQNRVLEYNPWDSPYGQGQGQAYVDFLADTVKPVIDADFRTLASPEHTGLLGSSMGGLISLYGIFARPEFGRAGIFSPALEVGGQGVWPFVANLPHRAGIRLYMDVGTHEVVQENLTPEAQHRHSLDYLQMVQRLHDALIKKGYGTDQMLYVEDEGGTHREAMWARRLPNAMRFLLKTNGK